MLKKIKGFEKQAQQPRGRLPVYDVQQEALP
jgi:hypothetical protein